MTNPWLNDLDFVAARVHGRRSRMAGRERLDVLCRSRSLPELAQAVFPEAKLPEAAALQRHAVQELIRELAGLRAAIGGAGGRLLDWLLVRFQLENLRVLLRAHAARVPFAECRPHLVTLPNDLALDEESLATADSVIHFAGRLPRGVFRTSLEHLLAAQRESLPPFFGEAALDRAYFQELLQRVGRLPGEDRAIITALAQQEADLFHLMLVARGRFHHALPSSQLLPFHVAGTRIPRSRFAAMLADSNLRSAMTRAISRALDALPAGPGPAETAAALDAAIIESLAWKRFVRLANRAFRVGHVGLGAVVGYSVLRRAEAANLITLSEGLRLAIPADALRSRMIPRAEPEVTLV